jgi:CheY-like chemotaxis protein
MKIFYLDDDIEELLLFTDVLKDIDPAIDCISLTDSNEALLQLEKNSAPDLIFLDFNMPGLTGEDCLQKIRTMAHLGKVPVIIYSTGVNERMEQQLLAKGADMVVKKHQSTSELKFFFRSNFLAPGS